MFIVATFHIAMSMARTIEGYANHPGTSETLAYLGELRPWHHILQDVWVPLQEDLGGLAAIYRVYIVWGHNWRIIILPTILLVADIIAGFTVIGKFAAAAPGAVLFDESINQWLKTFFSVTVVLNIITTSLLAYRIWRTDQASAPFRTGQGLLRPFLQILIESASLQLTVQLLLLILYCVNDTALFIVHDASVPIVGITFNAITLRSRMLLMKGHKDLSTWQPSSSVPTIGSLPMRRVNVQISTEVEEDNSTTKSEVGHKQVVDVV
ncbi:hypothetical protein K435DRAFT_966118 [Dendrothele bispora CBS 962.96]|uniref:Uncharacterized protein n=1 Tax=Dendrothele bispora (strain CBS 962.96) TaxID=1314807 RepID=A0A4S8M1R2_DENBC|nr:hypothetical protein K435DRAFT_966118 [Dendrothele bispora CBS 962.96]